MADVGRSHAPADVMAVAATSLSCAPTSSPAAASSAHRRACAGAASVAPSEPPGRFTTPSVHQPDTGEHFRPVLLTGSDIARPAEDLAGLLSAAANGGAGDARIRSGGAAWAPPHVATIECLPSAGGPDDGRVRPGP